MMLYNRNYMIDWNEDNIIYNLDKNLGIGFNVKYLSRLYCWAKL